MAGFIPYPDVDDDAFYRVTFNKREFRNTLVPSSLYDQVDDERARRLFALQPHQEFIRNFIAPHTPYNSALLCYGTGAGKTYGALAVAEGHMAFLERNKKLVYILTPNETVRDNFLRALYDPRLEQLEEEDGVPPGAYRMAGTTYGKENHASLIRKRYCFMGYRKFANYVASLSDTEQHTVFHQALVIVDEAHNLTGTDTESKPYVPPYGVLKRLFTASVRVKLLLLTATPMKDQVSEFGNMLELMWLNDGRSWNHSQLFASGGAALQANAAAIKQCMRGYVSFVEGNNPRYFPVTLYDERSTYFPTATHSLVDATPVSYEYYDAADNVIPYNLISVPMSDAQYAAHCHLLDESGTSSLQRRLRLANVCITGTDEDWSFRLSLRRHMDRLSLADHGLHESAPKLAVLTDAVLACKGISYVFSNYKTGGAEAVKYAMLANGVVPYSASAVYVRDGRLHLPGIRKLPEMDIVFEYLSRSGIAPQDFFVCATCCATAAHCVCSHGFAMATFVYITGELSDDRDGSQDRMSDIFAATSRGNEYGQVIKVIIGTNATAQGVDLKWVRQVHILDPWWNNTRIHQAIGRAARCRSHAELPPDKRNVTVFKYCSVPPFRSRTDPLSLRETVDEYVYRIVMEKDVNVKLIERMMREASVDGTLNLVQNRGPHKVAFSRDCEYNDCAYTCDGGMDTVSFLRYATKDYAVVEDASGRVTEIGLTEALRYLNLTSAEDGDAFKRIQVAYNREGYDKVVIDHPMDSGTAPVTVDTSTYDCFHVEHKINKALQQLKVLFAGYLELDAASAVRLLADMNGHGDGVEFAVYVALHTLIGNPPHADPVSFYDRLGRRGHVTQYGNMYRFTTVDGYTVLPLRNARRNVPLTRTSFLAKFSNERESVFTEHDTAQLLIKLAEVDGYVSAAALLNTVSLANHLVLLQEATLLALANPNGPYRYTVEYYVRSLVLFIGSPTDVMQRDKQRQFESLSDMLSAVATDGIGGDCVYHVLGDCGVLNADARRWEEPTSMLPEPECYTLHTVCTADHGWVPAFHTTAGAIYLFVDHFRPGKVHRDMLAEGTPFVPQWRVALQRFRTLPYTETENLLDVPAIKLMRATPCNGRLSNRGLATWHKKTSHLEEVRQTFGLDPTVKTGGIATALLAHDAALHNERLVFANPFLLEYYCPEKNAAV